MSIQLIPTLQLFNKLFLQAFLITAACVLSDKAGEIPWSAGGKWCIQQHVIMIWQSDNLWIIVSGAWTADKQTTPQIIIYSYTVSGDVLGSLFTHFLSAKYDLWSNSVCLNHSCVLLSKLHKVCPEAKSLYMKHSYNQYQLICKVSFCLAIICSLSAATLFPSVVPQQPSVNLFYF